MIFKGYLNSRSISPKISYFNSKTLDFAYLSAVQGGPRIVWHFALKNANAQNGFPGQTRPVLGSSDQRQSFPILLLTRDAFFEFEGSF